MESLILNTKNIDQLVLLNETKIKSKKELKAELKAVNNVAYSAKLKRAMADLEAGRMHKISLDEIWK